MLFAAFVIGKLRAAQRFDQGITRNRAHSEFVGRGRRDRSVQRCQGHARVAIGRMRQPLNQLIRKFGIKTSESASFIGQRASQDDLYFAFVERIQDQDPAAGKQRAGYFK